MAQTTVAMAGIASPHLLEPSLAPSSLPTHTTASTNSKRPGFTPLLSIRSRHAAHTEDPSPSRRAMLGLLAAPALLFVKDAQAASSIKVFGPPPPSGGLPGTENADQARDTDLPLKDRFYIQPLSPSEAAARAKESAKEIVNVKSLIEKKAWPYVQNDLRLRASYLRYDLNTIISTKAKDEKKALKSLTSKLFDTIDNLDYAARSKSLPKAQKYYAETVSALNDLLSKIA